MGAARQERVGQPANGQLELSRVYGMISFLFRVLENKVFTAFQTYYNTTEVFVILDIHRSDEFFKFNQNNDLLDTCTLHSGCS